MTLGHGRLDHEHEQRQHERQTEGDALHAEFASLMARIVVQVGSLGALKILQQAARLIKAEAKKDGHSPPVVSR